MFDDGQRKAANGWLVLCSGEPELLNGQRAYVVLYRASHAG
jgi:hypothetical protein